MSQVYTIGRVTADFELQYSANHNPYVRFSLAETLGYGETARTQYLQVWAWAEDAKRLLKRKVKKGSHIWVSGSLELEEFQKRDQSTDKRLKITLDNWDFVSHGKAKADHEDRSSTSENSSPDNSTDQPSAVGEIDGDRDQLPG